MTEPFEIIPCLKRRPKSSEIVVVVGTGVTQITPVLMACKGTHYTPGAVGVRKGIML